MTEKDQTGQSEFDEWVQRIPEHVDELTDRLTAERRAAQGRESRERRRPFLIDPATGHTQRTQLCWICGSMPVHAGKNLPKFRACRFCLVHDRQQASRLNLLMLVPLMDWPSQPVLPGRKFPTNRRLVNGLADLWCSVSVLDAWRVSSAQLALAYMGFDPEVGMDLYQWQQQLTVGPHRSQACWRAYLGGHFGELLDLVMDSGLPTRGIVW